MILFPGIMERSGSGMLDRKLYLDDLEDVLLGGRPVRGVHMVTVRGHGLGGRLGGGTDGDFPRRTLAVSADNLSFYSLHFSRGGEGFCFCLKLLLFIVMAVPGWW